MNKIVNIEEMKIREIEKEYPFALSFFENNNLEIAGHEEKTFDEYLNNFSEEEIEEWAIDTEKIRIDFMEYISEMLEFLGLEKDDTVDRSPIGCCGCDLDYPWIIPGAL